MEEMYQSTPPESEVNGIGVETKSDTHANGGEIRGRESEAAANLLRNWLNEDWN